MPLSKLLIDTNSYLRLAQSIRPLLDNPFCEQQYCIFVLEDLNEELTYKRLSNKFPWAAEPEYIENRAKYPTASNKQKKEIQTNYEHMLEYAYSLQITPSKVDIRYIAYGLELEIPVITDDKDMSDLAKEFGVKILSTLELLKLMLDCGHIDIKKVQSISTYLTYSNDEPINFKHDLERLFNL